MTIPQSFSTHLRTTRGSLVLKEYDADGEWVMEQEQLQGLQNNYFQELFTSKRTSSTSYRHRTIGEILAAQPPRLTPKDIV